MGGEVGAAAEPVDGPDRVGADEGGGMGEGHIIDSDILRRVFNRIVEDGGEFEVLEFTVGKSNDSPSFARIAASSGGETVDLGEGGGLARALASLPTDEARSRIVAMLVGEIARISPKKTIRFINTFN